jgi:uncharacterized protein
MRPETLTPITLRMSLLLALALAGLAASGSARAQSFDCEAASGRVEEMICAEEALGQADTGLSEAWRETIDVAADPAGLVRSQRAWLRTRNACPDKACVMAAYRQRTPVVRAAPRAGWAVHRDLERGITFEYLANREVKPCPEAYGPCIAIYGYARGRPDTLLVTLQAFDGALEEIASREAGFEARDGGWFTTYGRFEPQPVELFQKDGLSGMQATIICGVSIGDGFHAAAGECYYGVLSDGRRSVVATTDGGAGGLDESTNWSLTTLNFTQP